MRKTLMLALLPNLLLPLPALAWGTKVPTPSKASSPASAATSTATATSINTSHSASKAITNVVVNSASSSSSAQRQAHGSARTNPIGNRSGNNNSSNNNAPSLLAPSIVGGNPCAVGLTLGGSATSAAGLLGILWESSDCAARQDAALLANLGQTQAAIERLCLGNMDNRYAMAAIDRPCVEDRKRWLAAGWNPATMPAK